MGNVSSITEVLNSHGIGWLVFIIIALSLFIEITPVKINPLSTILRYIGNCMFSDVDKRLDAIERRMDENEIDRIRWEILNFANDCRRGRNPVKDEYEHIISQNSKYKSLIKKYDIANDVYTEEYNFILDRYHNFQNNKI